jgi:hypothetical protein
MPGIDHRLLRSRNYHTSLDPQASFLLIDWMCTRVPETAASEGLLEIADDSSTAVVYEDQDADRAGEGL